ncbi:Fzd5p [Balamuthia mandrillaris]
MWEQFSAERSKAEMAMLCVVLVLLAAGVPFSEGQAPPTISDPQNPSGRCVNISSFTPEELHNCDEFLDYDLVYYDEHTPIRLTLLNGIFLYFSGADSECLLRIYQFACSFYFRRCEEVLVPEENRGNSTTTTTAVAAFTCHHICNTMRQSCIASVDETAVNPAEVVSCEKPYYEAATVRPKEDIFPEGPSYNVSVTADGGNSYFNVTLDCFGAYLEGQGALPYSCPSGFHPEKNFCTYDCPQPLVTDEEYDALQLVITIFGWISFVFLSLLIASYLIVPSKRSYPAHLPLFFFIALLGRSFAFCLGSMVGHHEVWCGDDNTANQWGDPWCTIQGIFFVYFTLAGAAWWLAISVQLFLSVVAGRSTATFTEKEFFGCKPSLNAVFHLSCWLLPLVPVIIALSAHRLGFGNDLWCTIHSAEQLVFETTPNGPVHQEDTVSQSNIWNLVLLTLPIFVCVLIGVVLLLMVVILGYKKSHQGWKFFTYQWRLIGFLMIYVWIYTFVLSYQIHFHATKEDQYHEYSLFLKCSFRNAAAEVLDQPVPSDCVLDSKISYPVWMLATFSEVAQGFFVFLIFGTSVEILNAWFYLIRNRRLSRDELSSDSEFAKSTSTPRCRKVHGRQLVETKGSSSP